MSRTTNRPAARSARPNSLIYTLYGDFVHRSPERDLGDELPAASLIRLMSEFGISEQAVRQAVSRMSRQGWLAASRRGARAFYALTPRGRERIETLSPRIYGPAAEWDGRWRMVTYSVAENHRDRRDKLRKDLTVLGLAPLSASTWISPSDVLADVRAIAAANGVFDGGVDFFVGTYAGPLGDRALIEKCWDLDTIAGRYRDFIDTYASRSTAEGVRALADAAAFVERVWLVHDFRKFTYVDPGLPGTLLPAHWPGTEAGRLFRDYYARLSPAAERFFGHALRAS